MRYVLLVLVLVGCAHGVAPKTPIKHKKVKCAFVDNEICYEDGTCEKVPDEGCSK